MEYVANKMDVRINIVGECIGVSSDICSHDVRWELCDYIRVMLMYMRQRVYDELVCVSLGRMTAYVDDISGPIDMRWRIVDVHEHISNPFRGVTPRAICMGDELNWDSALDIKVMHVLTKCIRLTCLDEYDQVRESKDVVGRQHVYGFCAFGRIRVI